jgi:hypothetical protein
MSCTVNYRLNCVSCAVELVRSFCPRKGVVCSVNIGRPISEYQVTFNRLITPEDTRGEVLVSAYKYGSLAVSRLLGQPNTSILFFSIPPSLHPHSDRPTRQINSKRYHPVITECSRFSAEGCSNTSDSAQTIHIALVSFHAFFDPVVITSSDQRAR